MQSAGDALFYLGYAAFIVGYLWALALVFRDNVLLGFICLVVPLALLVALVRRGGRCWRPLTLWLAGFAACMGGLLLTNSVR